MFNIEVIFVVLKVLMVIFSIFGYSLCLNRKFKIKKEFTLILVVSIISVVLVFARNTKYY